MPKLGEVCRHVRSKNAGPFWITVDLFFKDEAAYAAHRDSTALSARSFADLYGVDEAFVRRYAVDSLRVLKISYPRPVPQGGSDERDMHGGQQYVRLLDLEL